MEKGSVYVRRKMLKIQPVSTIKTDKNDRIIVSRALFFADFCGRSRRRQIFSRFIFCASDTWIPDH